MRGKQQLLLTNQPTHPPTHPPTYPYSTLSEEEASDLVRRLASAIAHMHSMVSPPPPTHPPTHPPTQSIPPTHLINNLPDQLPTHPIKTHPRIYPPTHPPTHPPNPYHPRI